MSLLARVKHPPNITDYTEVNVHPAEQYLSVDDHGFLQTSPETSGFDPVENVFKVALFVWDTDTLSWVRATQAASTGGSTATALPKKKLFEQATSTILYIGEADPGSLEAALSWRIKRVTFDASGNPVAIEYAALGASTQPWSNRSSLAYY